MNQETRRNVSNAENSRPITNRIRDTALKSSQFFFAPAASRESLFIKDLRESTQSAKICVPFFQSNTVAIRRLKRSGDARHAPYIARNKAAAL